MNMSPEINELATALSLFQGEVMDASKDKKGYGYNYADLSNVLEIARPLMAKNGLSLAQFPTLEEGRVCVESILMHKSGQYMSSRMDIPYAVAQKQSEAQAVGAVITYARRYSVGAILGITQTDADACPKDIEKLDHEQAQKASYAVNTVRPSLAPLITDIQVKDLRGLVGTDLDLIKYLKSKYKIQNLEECTQGQYFEMKDELRVMKSTSEDSNFLNNKVA